MVGCFWDFRGADFILEDCGSEGAVVVELGQRGWLRKLKIAVEHFTIPEIHEHRRFPVLCEVTI